LDDKPFNTNKGKPIFEATGQFLCNVVCGSSLSVIIEFLLFFSNRMATPR